MAAVGMVSAIGLGALTACESGEAALDSWCDRGNRVYIYDDPNDGTELHVLPEAADCPEGAKEVSVKGGKKVLGDTVPMPPLTGKQEGPYKPYTPPKAVVPAPKPQAPPKVFTKPRTTYRIFPEAW